MRRFAGILLTVLLLAMGAAAPAQAEEGPSFTIALDADGALYDGPEGWFALDGNATTASERYVWHLDLPATFVVGDIHIPAGLFDVERPQQVVPSVNVSATHFPLFARFPRDEVWTATSPAQVYRFIPDGADVILRLGFPGPLNGTFRLERDVTPPSYEIGPVTQLVHFGFRQESTTNEFALADLRLRPVGGGLELENPTTVYALLQKFPVKGLRPETEYEAWIHFEDWAGNNATSPSYRVTTPARPLAPAATIEPRAPLADETGVDPDVVIEVAITAPSADSVSDIRLFLDLEEIGPGWSYDDGILRYAPRSPLEEGRHRISVDVIDAYGNVQDERWAFWVGPGPGESPGPNVLAILVGLVALLVLVVRRR